jgi:hypothetical protein
MTGQEGTGKQKLGCFDLIVLFNLVFSHRLFESVSVPSLGVRQSHTALAIYTQLSSAV